MILSSLLENCRDLRAIIDLLRIHGGHCYLVGGGVRDSFLGKAASDIDVEVFGLSSRKIISILSGKYSIDLVGKSYGILKVRGLNIDIGVPRKERKKGSLHTDFEIEEDPFLPVEEAIKRRDFTINSIYFDTQTNDFVDPFNGILDLKNKILRHTSERFSEDPLRVLRGMQFCARFELKAHPDTVQLCQKLSPEHLSPERIYWEFIKFLLKGQVPSLGLDFLKDVQWTQYFPELHKLIGLQQDLRRHPEGDVYNHVGCVLNAFAKHRTGDVTDDTIVGFALLCHDFGKPATTFQDKKGIHSYWHEIAGILPARTFLERMRVPKDIMQQALVLVQHHMEPRLFFKKRASDADFRRLSYHVRRLDLLTLIGYCDCDGRVENNEKICAWMKKKIQALGIEKAPPKALIQGRDLIKLGLPPSRDFSKMLIRIYLAQLNGDFFTYEEALDFAKKVLDREKFLRPKEEVK